MRILVTGGAGFIGSAVARMIIANTKHKVLVFDSLTYAGNLGSLAPIDSDPRFTFVRGSICDVDTVRSTIARFEPDAIMNLAAESHVDRSIDGPGAFIQTNIVGTYALLQEALLYWRRLRSERQENFRFHHISTDEVYGSLGPHGSFSEHTPYAPNSPYSATKASSDHLVRAWHRTYGLPTMISSCSNNYGPYHFPEKLIPLAILNSLEGKPLPVYGSGENVRDWLFVEDHAEALLSVVSLGVPGESYNIGGNSERRNIDVVYRVCDIVDELSPDAMNGSRRRLVTFVTDRPGHDERYAIDCSKITRELGWQPTHTFDEGLRRTVTWFLTNRAWWQALRSGVYRGDRLGMLA